MGKAAFEAAETKGRENTDVNISYKVRETWDGEFAMNHFADAVAGICPEMKQYLQEERILCHDLLKKQ